MNENIESENKTLWLAYDELYERFTELEAANRWIPVSETSEVAYGESYLVWYGDSYGIEMALDPKLRCPFSERVTHWKEIPEPPEVHHG